MTWKTYGFPKSWSREPYKINTKSTRNINKENTNKKKNTQDVYAEVKPLQLKYDNFNVHRKVKKCQQNTKRRQWKSSWTAKESRC